MCASPAMRVQRLSRLSPGTTETSGGAKVLGPGLPDVLAVATEPAVEQPATRAVPFWVAAVRWAKGAITCKACH